MTDKPLLHPTSATTLERWVKQPPHAILISGPASIGKSSAARWLAEQILAVPTVDSYPYALQLAPSEPGKSIGIETLRQLEHFLARKVASRRKINRIIIINDAQLLTVEAQNSLLKTLEEPPTGTMLILTAASTAELLPTVVSRLQLVEMVVPTRNQLASLLAENGVPDSQQQQLIALSGGLPGLALALAQRDQQHPLVIASATARELLQQSTFERLCAVDALAKDKIAYVNILFTLSNMAHLALLTSRTPDRWRKILTACYQTEADLQSGVQTKLALTNLMLTL